jgi:hypothetical protein
MELTITPLSKIKEVKPLFFASRAAAKPTGPEPIIPRSASNCTITFPVLVFEYELDQD